MPGGVRYVTASRNRGIRAARRCLLELHERYPDRYPVLLESVGGAQAIGRHDLLLALPGEKLQLSGDRRLEGTRRSDGSAFLAALDAWWTRRAVHRHCDAACRLLAAGFSTSVTSSPHEVEPSLRLPRSTRRAALAWRMQRRDCPRPSTAALGRRRTRSRPARSGSGPVARDLAGLRSPRGTRGRCAPRQSVARYTKRTLHGFSRRRGGARGNRAVAMSTRQTCRASGARSSPRAWAKANSTGGCGAQTRRPLPASRSLPGFSGAELIARAPAAASRTAIASTRPIAGTRPRGGDARSDARSEPNCASTRRSGRST